MPIDALSVLCAQLTRDLLAIAKFLLIIVYLVYCRRHLVAAVIIISTTTSNSIRCISF